MDNYYIWHDWCVPEQYYIFAFETIEYSGNFERNACAFLTGCVGECGVGAKYAKKHNELFEEDEFDSIIMYVPDDHGCYRPVSGGRIDDNYGVFIYFETKDLDAFQKLIDRLPLVEKELDIHILNHYIIECKNIKTVNEIKI